MFRQGRFFSAWVFVTLAVAVFLVYAFMMVLFPREELAREGEVMERQEGGVCRDSPAVRLTGEAEISYFVYHGECGHRIPGKRGELRKELPKDLRDIPFAGVSREELKSYLGAAWHITLFKEDILILQENREGYCGDCAGIGYVGIYQGRIALYRGTPPHGELMEITAYEAREVYQEELDRGIPYRDDEEKKRILESYTS